MSEPTPKFGDVYRHRDGQTIMVLSRNPKDLEVWQTITVRAAEGEEDHDWFGLGCIDGWAVVDSREWMRVE